MSIVTIDNYLDWEVFATRPNWASQPKQMIDHNYLLFQDFGRAYARSSVDIAREVLSYQFLFESKEEIEDMRNFFDSQYGQLGAFWLPSWRSDVIVNTAFAAIDTSLFIEDIKYAEYFLDNLGAGRYLMFLFPDLTRIYAKVIGAPADNQIILDEAIGKAASTADIQYLMVSFLYLVRFGVDEIRFDYTTNTIAEASINFRTIFTEAITSTTTTTTTTTTSTSTTSTSTTSTTNTTTTT